MKAKSLIYCVAAISMALVACKKDPKPVIEELILSADKEEAYAGEFITVTSNNPIVSFEAKDNLELSDYKLNVVQADEHTLKVYPGSGSTHVSNGIAHIDSKITLTVTDENDQTKTVDLNGKSWYFDIRVGDRYGMSLDYSDVKAGDKIYFIVKTADGRSLSYDDGFSVSFEGAAYKFIGKDESSDYSIIEVKGGAADYEVQATHKSRIVKVAPKSVK